MIVSLGLFVTILTSQVFCHFRALSLVSAVRQNAGRWPFAKGGVGSLGMASLNRGNNTVDSRCTANQTAQMQNRKEASETMLSRPRSAVTRVRRKPPNDKV